jgi:hypothetical protein
MTRTVVTLFWLFILGVPSTAADLSGSWRLDLNPNFGGIDQTLICALKQDDVMLSFDCEGGLFTGKIDGSIVTFQVKTGPKEESKATFQGTTNQAGTTITGIWRLEERTGKFTLTKR